MPRWTPAPIVGGSYKDDTRPFSVQDTVNLIPVVAEREGTRSASMLRCAPGLSDFCDLGTQAPIRGMRNVEGLLLAVSGTSLFSVGPKGEKINIGVIPGVGRVSMSHNQITGGNEVAIANGTSGYVYNTVTAQLQRITDEGFPGAVTFDYIDSYITFIEPGRRFAGTSDLADALSYNTLDREEAEGSPDKLVGQIVSHREWWLFGERTIEPYINTGAATGTFQRASGTVMEVGAASPYAICRLDNSVFWLGSDGVVYRASGYVPERISTHPIEQAISRCNTSTAFAFTYEDRGHKIFYITFQDGQTWGFDVATKEWHRRESKGLSRWRINDLVRWNGKWIAGDYSNGKLYELDWDVQTEAGVEMERMRVTGVLSDDQNPIIVNAVELVFDTGQPQKDAAIPPLNVSGNAPDGVVGQAYSFTYGAAGGVIPRTFSISAGSLPDGLSLNALTGELSGIPITEEARAFTVMVTDSVGSIASTPDSIAIVLDNFYNVVLEDEPVYYLPMSETSGTIAMDVTGNGHHGTIVGSPTLGGDGLRPGGRSFEFGEVGQYVSIPNGSYANEIFEANHPWSAEVIVRRSGRLASSSERIMGKFVNGNTGNSTFDMAVANGATSPVIAGGYFSSAGAPHFASDPSVMVDGNIYIACVTYDGTNVRLYVDGTLVSTILSAEAGQNIVSPITIGGSNSFPGSYQFKGSISDCSLYDYALSQERVLAHATSAGVA